jgi:DUF971 family protein
LTDTAQPTQIQQAGPRELEITWSDGVRSVYDVVHLRRACRCAACIDEWSGAQILQPDQVSEDVRPQKIDLVGRYALSVHWSDGHSSGIYTFEYLRKLAAAEQSGETS